MGFMCLGPGRVVRRNARRMAMLAKQTDGAVALVLAAMLAGLAGITALAFDLGRAWNLSTELQSAVDAAALAGASQLDGAPGARLRAVRAAAGSLARNGQIFASASGPGEILFDTEFSCLGDGCIMTNDSFRFLASLEPRLDALGDADARYVESRVSRSVGFVFAGRTVPEVASRARAVAGWQRFACGRAVVLMCNPDEPPGNTDPRYPFVAARHSGQGIALRLTTGVWPPTGAGEGDAAWAAPVFCDPATDGCSARVSEDEVRSALGRVDSSPACLSDIPPAVPASLSAVAEVLNTRLDIYPTGAGLESDPAYQPSPNPLTGLVLAEGAAPGVCDFPSSGEGALRLPTRAFAGPGRHPPLGTMPLDHMGYPRDNCAYPDIDGGPPPDNCIAVPPPDSGLPAGRALGTGLWDVQAYLNFHHPGVGFESAGYNRCAVTGCRLGDDGSVDRDGDGRLSRYEVYLWELGGHPPMVGRPLCFADSGAGLPQPPFDPSFTPDRRVLGILIENCGAVATLAVDAEVPLAGGDAAAMLFLSEAVGELSADRFYGELIAPEAVDGLPPLSPHDRLVLQE